MLNSNNKKTNHRLDSTKKYIDDLSKNYSKLNIVRVDLGYTKKDSKNMTIEELRLEVEILKKFQAFLKQQRVKR